MRQRSTKHPLSASVHTPVMVRSNLSISDHGSEIGAYASTWNLQKPYATLEKNGIKQIVLAAGIFRYRTPLVAVTASIILWKRHVILIPLVTRRLRICQKAVAYAVVIPLINCNC